MTSVTLHVEELLSQIRNIPEDTQPETPLLFMETAGKQPIKIMHCVYFENTWVSKYPADCPEIFFFQSILKITFTSFAGLRLSSESNAFEVIKEQLLEWIQAPPQRLRPTLQLKIKANSWNGFRPSPPPQED